MKRPDSEDDAPAFRAGISALVVLAAVVLSSCGAAASSPATNDADVVGIVGLGWTGLSGALPRLAAALALLVPIGTRALRAALFGSLVCGASAWVLFDVGARFARATLGPLFPRAPRLVLAVAGAAALSAALGPAFVREASSVSSALLPALVVLAALREASLALGPLPRAPRIPACALLLGLAVTCDVFVLAAVVLAFAPRLVRFVRRLRAEREEAKHAAVAFLVGLAPLVTSLATRARAPEIALDVTASSGFLPVPLGTGRRGLAAFGPFVATNVGPVVVVCAGAAAVLVALALKRLGKDARSLLDVQLAIGGIVLAAGVSLLVGPSEARSSAIALAALGALHAEAAVALAALALALARAPVPFARASAALVVVLEMVLPVRSADEALAQRDRIPHDATSTWTTLALGPAPPAAVLLVSHPSLSRRIAAARATGEMRGDILVVPSGDPRSRVATRALATEPKLAPLYRDLVLGSPPEELSLTQLAGTRPVLVSYEKTWDRSLARHLTPVGLFGRFDAEPRGVVDRRRAFDATTAVRDALSRAILERRDPELVSLTATLLRARALGVAGTGDREQLSRAIDHLRTFAPDDPIATQLVRRIVTSKGPIEVSDLPVP